MRKSIEACITAAGIVLLLSSLCGADEPLARYTLGAGVGYPYGMYGAHGEVLLFDRIAPSFGIGSWDGVSTPTGGIKIYLTNPSARTRVRLGYMYGTVRMMMGYSTPAGNFPTEGVEGTFLFCGIQGRISENFSLDFDLGISHPNKKEAVRTITAPSGYYSNSYTFNDAAGIGLGLTYHFNPAPRKPAAGKPSPKKDKARSSGLWEIFKFQF